ncbi:hypothetical protein BMS3Bbin04_00957 [bacterium BMS3Bbin04]|nr:hypothetical protein BMS3Bbin04_00957 [bacterium BMS3Bbin04]
MLGCSGRFFKEQSSTHPQMDDEWGTGIGELDQDELSASGNIANLPAFHTCTQRFRCTSPMDTWMIQIQPGDCCTEQARTNAPDNSFDFWQFRHGVLARLQTCGKSRGQTFQLALVYDSECALVVAINVNLTNSLTLQHDRYYDFAAGVRETGEVV